MHGFLTIRNRRFLKSKKLNFKSIDDHDVTRKEQKFSYSISICKPFLRPINVKVKI